VAQDRGGAAGDTYLDQVDAACPDRSGGPGQAPYLPLFEVAARTGQLVPDLDRSAAQAGQRRDASRLDLDADEFAGGGLTCEQVDLAGSGVEPARPDPPAACDEVSRDELLAEASELVGIEVEVACAPAWRQTPQTARGEVPGP